MRTRSSSSSSSPSRTTLISSKRVRRGSIDSSHPSKRRAYTPPSTPSRAAHHATNTTAQVVIPPSRVKRTKPGKQTVISLEKQEHEDGNDKENRVLVVEDLDDSDQDTVEEEVGTTVEEMEVEAKDKDDTENAIASLPTPAATPTKAVSVQAEPEVEVEPEPEPTVAAARPPANIFAHAGTLLSVSSSGVPYQGRRTEMMSLSKFISNRFPSIYPSTPSPSTSTTPPTTPKTIKPSLYISGPPGIGKTALINSVIEEFKQRVVDGGQEDTIKVVVENCSSIGSISLEMVFWERLATGLGLELERTSSGGGKMKGREAFEKAIKAGGEGKQYLIVLDEIDHLLPSSTSRTTSSNLLNSIFSLAHSPNSPITLIGIANALDLTTRSLQLESISPSPSPSPRKKGVPSTPARKIAVGPQTLQFAPYTPEVLESIVKSRLALLSPSYPMSTASPPSPSTTAEASFLPLIEPKALELCAKKVAKTSGDVRTILGIVRKAILIVERNEVLVQEEKRKMMEEDEKVFDEEEEVVEEGLVMGEVEVKDINEIPVEPPSTSTLRTSFLSTFTPLTAPKVNMKIMLEALRLGGLGTPLGLPTQLSSLNFDHRASLIGIIIAIAREDIESGSGKGFNLRDLTKTKSLYVEESIAHKIYLDFLEKDGTFKGKNKNVFRDALTCLECEGFLEVKNFEKVRNLIGGKKKGKIGAGTKVVLLSGKYSVKDLADGLKVTPMASSDLIDIKEGGGGVLQETVRVSKKVLEDAERDLVIRKNKKLGIPNNRRDVMAPMEGFHGDGIDLKGATKWIGEKGRA